MTYLRNGCWNRRKIVLKTDKAFCELSYKENPWGSDMQLWENILFIYLLPCLYLKFISQMSSHLFSLKIPSSHFWCLPFICYLHSLKLYQDYFEWEVLEQKLFKKTGLYSYCESTVVFWKACIFSLFFCGVPIGLHFVLWMKCATSEVVIIAEQGWASKGAWLQATLLTHFHGV